MFHFITLLAHGRASWGTTALRLPENAFVAGVFRVFAGWSNADRRPSQLRSMPETGLLSTKSVAPMAAPASTV